MHALQKFRTFFLGKLVGIERHEYRAVAWSFAYFFCVLSAYYIIRPVRETFAVNSGPGTIPYLFIGTFAATLIATTLFGWIASRFARRVFLPWVYLFFIANILVFWYLFPEHTNEDLPPPQWLGRTFFVWLSVFNLFVVSVFWSFMADIYTREQGRRLFGVISAGGSIGALLGGLFTSYYVTDIGYQYLFLLAAVVLSVALLCIARLRRWIESEHAEDLDTTAAGGETLGGNAFTGISHVFGSRYFMAIVASSVLASLLGTALYMFAAQLVEQEIAGTNARTAFFSSMNTAQNFITLFAQLFLVRQVVARFGLGRSLMLMPAVSIAGFVALAISPVLGVVAFLTVARRAIGFGFMKPSTDMLYSVVTPEEKYKAKNFIDLAVYRGGDVLGTWAVKLIMAAGMTMASVSMLLIPFAVVWTWVTHWLGEDYRRQARQLKDSGIS